MGQGLSRAMRRGAAHYRRAELPCVGEGAAERAGPTAGLGAPANRNHEFSHGHVGENSRRLTPGAKRASRRP
jgi:hypothetical protein